MVVQLEHVVAIGVGKCRRAGRIDERLAFDSVVGKEMPFALRRWRVVVVEALIHCQCKNSLIYQVVYYFVSSVIELQATVLYQQRQVQRKVQRASVHMTVRPMR